jgi:predicted ribosome quality control (RQC) complex YloA/Tae2 family protein
MAQSWPEIDDVIQAVQEQGFAVHEKKVRRIGGAGRSGPMKLTDKDGFVVYVGRNSRQNEQVAFRIANSDDIWLHARDVPGSHVVIRNDGRRISDELIEKAASVAAYYSSKQRDAKVDVDVTRCKYVKPIKGAGPGMVTYRNEDTITVRPRSADDVFKTDTDDA